MSAQFTPEPNSKGILPCTCGSYPSPKGDYARPDDGWRSMWCDGCLKHVTGWEESEQRAIELWNEQRELDTGTTAWMSSEQSNAALAKARGEA
jgi:hypothetical protein